jgi:hypothetical protein
LAEVVDAVAACGAGPPAPTAGCEAAEIPGGGLDPFALPSESRDAAYGKPIVTPNNMATISSRDIVFSSWAVESPVGGYYFRCERQAVGAEFAMIVFDDRR